MDGILNDKSIMEASISRTHAGKELGQINAGWYLWYRENIAPTYANQSLRDYIKDNLQVLEKQAKQERDEYFKNKNQ